MFGRGYGMAMRGRLASWLMMAAIALTIAMAVPGGAWGQAVPATQAQIQAVQSQAQAAASAAQAAQASGASNAGALQQTSSQLSSFSADLSSGKATVAQSGQYVTDATALASLQSALGQTGQPQTPQTPAQTPAGGAGSSDLQSAVTQMVATLTGQCWSCDFYGKIVNGMDQVFQQSYAYFQGLNTFMGFIALLIAIVICWKVVWFFSPLTRDEFQVIQKWEEIMSIFLRTIVIFTVFLSAAGLQYAKTASTTSTFNPVRDLFFDGPLAVGTSIGCDLAKAAGGASSVPGVNAIACGDASLDGSWLATHVSDAKAMLMAFHTLGVQGIGLGFRTAIAGSGNSASDIATKIVLVLAGLPVVMMFVGWTISFGLRYIDVALRAMVALSLFPVFAALWIFDSTRPISHVAMKSVFFMMALFSVSGLTYTIALAMLTQGLLIVGGGQTIPQTLAVMNSGGGGGFFPGLNAVAITVGSWGVAIGVASMSFRLAEEMVSYEGGYQGEMGVGVAAGGQMTGTLGSAAGGVGKMI